jgi:CubicO group peptidase (beta-lactamase class C family)
MILQATIFAALSTLALAASNLAVSSDGATSDATAPIEGFWLGTLHAPAVSLRIQLTVKAEQGRLTCSLDSLDQGAFGLPCSNVVQAPDNFSFDIPVVNGHWTGRLSEDSTILAGTWTQGGELPLDFARQDKPQPPPAPPAVHFDPAMAPVGAADMQSVLKRDVQRALATGELAPATSAGVAIGVVHGGIRRVFAFGAAKPDSIFEIGSITKTFTGLILAQMVQQGRVRLEQPVRELLPFGVPAADPGSAITLLDLVTQHSGLPRMPDNFEPADPANPYADYGDARLQSFVVQHGLSRPADSGFLYSNLGFALLGRALANSSATSYEELLRREVTGPLGMNDTSIELSKEQRGRFIPGHLPNHQPAHAWDLNAFVGAGGIRSTAYDMLRYLEAQLHPESLAAARSPYGRTLGAALIESHRLRADVRPGSRIAFAWMHDANFEYWHNGATGGYSSMAFFDPASDIAAVVLLNTTIGNRRGFAEVLAEHIAQRFKGQPAVALADEP